MATQCRGCNCNLPDAASVFAHLFANPACQVANFCRANSATAPPAPHQYYHYGGLRPHQVQTLLSLQELSRQRPEGGYRALVDHSVGSGKTVIIGCAANALRLPRTIVFAPRKAIRETLLTALDGSENHQSIYRAFSLLQVRL